MKKLSFGLMACAILIATPSYSQNFLKQLGNAAKNAAKNSVERNVTNKVDEGVNKAFDANSYKSNNEKQIPEKNKEQADKQTANGWQCPQCGNSGITGKFCPECGTKKPEASSSANTWTCEKCNHTGNTGNFCDECGAKKGTRNITGQYSKSDFVPGDVIIFADNFEGEQLGEFPSKWDLIRGVSEIVKFDGRTTFDFQDVDTRVAPLMKDPHNYLTSEFTIEFDFFAGDNSTIGPDLYSRSNYILQFFSEEDGHICDFEWHTGDSKKISCYYVSTSDNSVRSDAELDALLNDGTWNHLAISFNKRAFKAYINGIRVINIPNMKAPTYLELESRLWGDHGVNYISDIRIAKGAVPLYDRLTTDGKIITYAITFEVGKATLKPEADVEINRIKKLMDDDASLKFEVQGHCDNTGSAATNDKLSQQRAEAIVARLVELGINKNRLTAVGKGSNVPIADNTTDEGRAKNRRVEFIKK